jgi:hypothetical protein
LLRIFPRELLHRIPAKTLDQYYSRDATHWLLIRVPVFWQVQPWINWTDWPCGHFAVFIHIVRSNSFPLVRASYL